MIDRASLLSRRSWLWALAGVSTAAGFGLAWRKQHPDQPTAEELAIWQLDLPQINGTLLALSVFKGKPLVLNFWATWCPPCVEELPLLSAFYSENKSIGWQVLGFAVDQEAPVKRFLSATPLSFPVALAGSQGLELSRSLGNLSGALPFTVVFGPSGRVVHRKIGRLSPSDIAAWKQFVV